MALPKLNVKPASYYVFGIVGIVLSIIYALAAANIADLSGYYSAVIGMMLGVVIWIESGWRQFMNLSKFRSLNGADIISIIGLIFGTGAFVSGLLTIPAVHLLAPAAVLTFFGTFGAIVGVVSALVMLLLLFI